MAAKETSDKMAKLASAVLSGKVTPTKAQAKSMAASLLSQDQTKGPRKPGK